MERLHLPQFLVENRGLPAIARQVAAHQIQQTSAAVFVCKAPPDEQHFMVEALYPAAHRLLIRQFQLTDQHIASFVLVGFGQRDQAVVLERIDEVLAFLEDELEVLLRRKPAVGQDIAELDGVRHAGGDH